jgi:hypothetical protein
VSDWQIDGVVGRADEIPASSVQHPLSWERQLDDLSRRVRLKLDNRTQKSHRWKQGNYLIGGAAAVLATAAGATSLSSWFGDAGDDVAAVLALLSGLLTSIVGFYDFGRRFARLALERAEWFGLSTRIQVLEAEWSTLRDDAERGARVKELLAQERTLWLSDATARGAGGG